MNESIQNERVITNNSLGLKDNLMLGKIMMKKASSQISCMLYTQIN